MPVSVSAIPTVSNLADVLARQISEGRAGRASVGAQDAAFAWTTGVPPSIVPYANRVACEGGSFNVTIVGASGTPAGAVAEGASKPNAIALTNNEVPLVKYAGLCAFSTEKAIYSDSLTGVVMNVLIAQAWAAFNFAVARAIHDNGSVVAAAADWTSAILGGVAEVITNGGNPQVLLMNPADYVAAVTSLSGGFVTPSADAVPSLFGLGIILSPGMTAGSAAVVDPSAVTVAELATGPLVVVDPYTGLATNAITCAAEYFAACVVTGPDAIAVVSVTAGP